MYYATRRRRLEPARPKRGLPPDMKLPNDLEAHANMTMAHLILQMSSLSQQAEETFSSLLKSAKQVSSRSSNLQTRINNLAEKVAKCNPARGESRQKSSIYEYANMLCPTRASSSVEYHQPIPVLSKENRPLETLKDYASSYSVPAFHEFNQFTDNNNGDCYNKLFSDPTYFQKHWKLSSTLVEMKLDENNSSQKAEEDADDISEWDSFEEDEFIEDPPDCSTNDDRRNPGHLLLITRRQTARPNAAPPPPPTRRSSPVKDLNSASESDHTPYSGPPVPPPLPPQSFLGPSTSPLTPSPKINIQVIAVAHQTSLVSMPSPLTPEPPQPPPPPPLPLYLCPPNPPASSEPISVQHKENNENLHLTKSDPVPTQSSKPPPPPPLPLDLLVHQLKIPPFTCNNKIPSIEKLISPPPSTQPPLPPPLPLHLLVPEVSQNSLPSLPIPSRENSKNHEIQAESMLFPPSEPSLSPNPPSPMPLIFPPPSPVSLDPLTNDVPLIKLRPVDPKKSLQTSNSKVPQDPPNISNELLEKLRARRRIEY